MDYRSVGGRCAVNMARLPLPREEALNVLSRKGFKPIRVDLIELARQLVGKSTYRRGVHINEAPTVVDCSSMIKWLYGQRGILLPRRSIQQLAIGSSISRKTIIAGDVVFVSGKVDYWENDPAAGVGHVGIATGCGTVIHAANKLHGVIETPIEEFAPSAKFRGVRRYVPSQAEVLTFETPLRRGVESADDIKWIILQNC